MHDAIVAMLLVIEAMYQAVSKASGQSWILSPGPGFQFSTNRWASGVMVGGVDIGAAGHVMGPFPDVDAI